MQAVNLGAKSAQSNSRQPNRSNVFAFAALATTILGYTLIGISMIQQQRCFASWDNLVPA
jgi:hypothetical protein